ncbi:hypothetical protein Pelo_812 [Pelomyxa schiedti]|nr:hypothetical protein Pelo_812 [Pelomyxa schiedti]
MTLVHLEAMCALLLCTMAFWHSCVCTNACRIFMHAASVGNVRFGAGNLRNAIMIPPCWSLSRHYASTSICLGINKRLFIKRTDARQ